MAVIKSKGTVLKQEISTVLTAVAQVISWEHSGAESETFEKDTLDNTSAGIPYGQTGRSEGGSFSFELFFDPALAGHQAITDLVITPAECDWELTFADTGTTQWPFTGAGVGFGVTVALADGLKASVSVKLSGICDYASGA
jgi:hypothetical protein